MKRGPLFLAAALVEVLRFFILMTFAAALGLLDHRPITPSFIRYVAVGQLLFFAVFFFLWYDEERYAVYRPLALAAKAISFVAFVPVALSLAGALFGEGFVPAGRSAVTGVFALPTADLLGLFVLALYRRSPRPSKAPSLAQQGPEDIESVEGIP